MDARVAYTFLVTYRDGANQTLFNAASNDVTLPYHLAGTLWRDNGSGGGGKENGLKAGTEILLNLPGSLLGGQAGHVVILNNTNTVVATAPVCVSPTATYCALGQSPGDWQATADADGPFILYVTNTASKPSVGAPVPSPVAIAPAGFGFTLPNANNSALQIQGTPPNGILTGIDPSTALTLNFGVVTNSCALP
jgi:hypothetical protein